MKSFLTTALLVCACVYGLPVQESAEQDVAMMISDVDEASPHVVPAKESVQDGIRYKAVDESRIHIHSGINRPDSPHPWKKDAANWKLTHAKVEVEPGRARINSWPLTKIGVPPVYPKTKTRVPFIHSGINRPDSPDPRHPEALNWDIIRRLHNHQKDLVQEIESKPGSVSKRRASLPPRPSKNHLERRRHQEFGQDNNRISRFFSQNAENPEQELAEAMRHRRANRLGHTVTWNEFGMDEPIFPSDEQDTPDDTQEPRRWFPDLSTLDITTATVPPLPSPLPMPTAPATRFRRQRTLATAIDVADMPAFLRDHWH